MKNKKLKTLAAGITLSLAFSFSANAQWLTTGNTVTSTPTLGINSGLFPLNIKTVPAQPINFFTTNSQRATILAGGNFGIGTTAPQHLFEVYGGFSNFSYNSAALPPSMAAGGLTLGWNKSAGGAEVNFYNVYNSATKSFVFSQKTGASTSTDLMTILGSGNIGIGTGTPAYKLQVMDIISSQKSGRAGYNIYNGGGNSEWFIGQESNASHNFKIQRQVSGVYTNVFDIDYLGNIGIGTTSPNVKLHVNATGAANGKIANFINGTYETFFVSGTTAGAWNNITKAGDNGIFWQDNGTVESNNGFVIAPWSAGTKGLRIDGNGHVGIGSTNFIPKFSIGNSFTFNDDEINSNTASIAFMYDNSDGWDPLPTKYAGAIMFDATAGNLSLATSSSVTGAGNYPIARFTVNKDGNVSIGARKGAGIHADARLSVDGKILATSMFVNSNTWADYVFAADYKLPKLADVEAFYLTNKHLPEIPTEKEVAENGIDLAEMNKLLLKKVEEMTIYMVQMQKEIEELKKQTK